MTIKYIYFNILILVLIVFSQVNFSVYGQNSIAVPVPTVEEAPIDVGPNENIIIEGQDNAASLPKDIQNLCYLWAEYQDTGTADYTPGVDVDGDAVAPADVSGSLPPDTFSPDKYTIPVNIDVAQYFDRDFNIGTEMFTTAGVVDIYTDGRVLYNGQSISDDLASVCQQTP